MATEISSGRAIAEKMKDKEVIRSPRSAQDRTRPASPQKICSKMNTSRKKRKAGHDPVAFFRQHHARIYNLHVKDRDGDAAHTYRRFGEGATPIEAVLKAARELRFRYAANIEWELDEQDPTANLMLGRSLWLEGEIESSVPWLERAIALSPNYAQAVYSRAWTHMILCQGEAGQQNARAAMRLSPIDPLRYAMIATDGFTQAMLGDETTGAALVDRAAREPRAHVMIAVMAAICQVWAGNRDGIRYWTNEIRSRGPNLTADVFLTSFPFKNGPLRERVSAALSVIGV